ncbi:hypothetical protein CS8_009000 [Cupriavidus sp. 8B]
MFGPSTEGLVGTQLAGAVIRMRGGLGSKLGSVSYDLFLGTPIYKPATFHTPGVTTGFQLVFQY